MQGRAGSETLHQQNPPVRNWRCRVLILILTQAELYNGRKTAVVVVAVRVQLPTTAA